MRELPDHRLLDRLIGGRIWIVLLGTLLVGIVTMQLSLLRLNAGIGRTVERTSALQQSNAALRMQISELSNSEGIVAQATQMGFVTPPQGSPRFVSASSADAARALTTMRVPDPAAAAATTAAATTDASTAAATATPVDATSTGATPPATSTPATGTTAGTTPPATGATGTTADTTAPATGATGTTVGTTPPATGTTAPAGTPPAGGASAPVGPQG